MAKERQLRRAGYELWAMGFALWAMEARLQKSAPKDAFKRLINVISAKSRLFLR